MKKLFLIPLLLVLPLGVQASAIEPEVTLNPYEGENNDFGSSVEMIDVSGDGIDDAIISTPTYGEAEGRIDIFFGQQDSLVSSTPSVSIVGGGDNEIFGDSFKTVPDVTGDNLPELVTSGQYATALDESLSTNTYSGILYFFSSESITNVSSDAVDALDFATAALVGEASNDGIGGDIQVYQGTNDTYLSTGAYATNTLQGSLYVFNAETLANLFANSTRAVITEHANIEIIGEAADTGFGNRSYPWTTAGYLVVAATSYDSGTGRVYFIPETNLSQYTTVGNSENVTDLASATVTANTADAYFGTRVLDIGATTVGNDRFLAINSSNDNVYVFTKALVETLEEGSGFGTAETDAIIHLQSNTEGSGNFGNRFMNIDDQYMAVSEHGYDNNTGVVYILKNSTLNTLADNDDAGAQTIASVADFIIYGDSINQNIGYQFSNLNEDIDGDGMNELITGSTGSTTEGSAVAGQITVVPSTIWFSQSGQTSTTISDEDFYTYTGAEDGDGLGWYIVSNGDLDNNGDIDIIASALNFTTSTGTVTTFYNLEDQFGNYEHLLALGHNSGNVTSQGIEERAYRSGSKVASSTGQAGKMLVTAGDVDTDGDFETIITLDSTNRCHTVYIYSGAIKDKQFRACHPNREQSVAYVTAGNYVSGSGQAYIAVAFPSETHGVYIQLYKRTSSGSYKKVHRKYIERSVDFSQGIGIDSGNLTSANSAQIVLAANGSPTLYVYKLSGANKLTKVTEKKVGSMGESINLSVDSSSQMVYTNKWGKKKVKAYTWDGDSIVKYAANSFTPSVEPYGLAAESGVVGVLKKKRNKLQLYYNGEFLRTNSYSKKIWSLNLVNQ